MPYQPATSALLKFLHNNPAIRSRIRAGANRTLLYAGTFGKPMWSEIDVQRRYHGQLLDKQTLPDVLRQITVPETGHPTLIAYVQHVESRVPWKPDGFTIWRALSGIFAANAVGKVSFMIGGGITRETKVFAATEASVLSRNPNVDPITKDLVAYYLNCIQSKQPNINIGFIAAT